MLYQELPRIDSAPLDGWARWLGPALVAGAALSAATLLLLVGWLVFAAIVALAGLGAAAFVHRNVSRHRTTIEAVAVAPDYSVIGSALALSSDPAALTSGEGSLLIANTAYRERFGSSRLPLDLGESEQDRQGLEVARSMAWRDGAGCVAGVHTGSGKTAVEVERALAHAGSSAGQRFADLVDVGEDGLVRLTAEGEFAQPMRMAHVPVDPKKSSTVGTFLLFEC